MFKHELEVLWNRVKTVTGLVRRKWWPAVAGLLFSFFSQHFLPARTWAGSVVYSKLHNKEIKAANLGWTIAATLLVLVVLLISEGLAQKRGGWHKGHTVNVSRWFVTGWLIPSIVGSGMFTLGAFAGFGGTGVLVGIVWLLMVLGVARSLQSFAGYAALPSNKH